MNYEEIITLLVTIRDQYKLTKDQCISLNYAISAVKTLEDMNHPNEREKEHEYMKSLIIGICYNTDGARYINEIVYTSFEDAISIYDTSQLLKKRNDEVYATELRNPSHAPFIDYIVKNGCRM